uniref:rRNA methyltransferase 2, mitochondrial n=1 Tax=Tremella fuciformis TaxID=64657 RepID=D5KY52_9TREE|nr:NADB Rossmann [Tremella fuciformis]
MMAPMSGVRMRDVQASLDLVGAATGFAMDVLASSADGADGGNLVLKFFAHPDLDAFRRTQLEPHFHKVHVDKPKESRKESSEAYWVCLGYRGQGHT